MNSPKYTLRISRIRRVLHLFLCVSAIAIAFPAAQASSGGEITAVSSQVSDDYIREKLPNGTFKSEAYAFGEGGHWSGAAHDDTIDQLRFSSVARTIASPLAGQNYVPATDPHQTKLLIMVYWGTTIGSTDDPTLPVMLDAVGKLRFKMQRDQADMRNAQLLGYDSEELIGTDYGRNMLRTGLHQKAEDLLDEIGDNRYFVVLMAYDFQQLWKNKKHKLLWETRFSVRERRNDFGKALPAMTRYASRYFGQNTHGLIRRPLQENISLGELKILGVEEKPTERLIAP